MTTLKSSHVIKAKPFLRWAGGKTWLLKHLTNVKKYDFNNYHEAFLGGAATFFYLEPKGHAFLSDLNKNLIETYNVVKTDVEDVIKRLKLFTNDEQSYYRIRESTYESPVERAAQFIYLNQTSYNGLYRVNLKGKYNVPYGFRKKMYIVDDNLRRVSLSLQNANIFSGDFSSVLCNLKERDLVFLDPPYTVSHNNNGFIEYNEKIFSLNDQIRLSEMIGAIKEKNAFYILTNAAHKTVDSIFERGDQKFELTRGNGIGGHKAQRGQTTEYIFTNIKL
ncbi:DNA adenine methylase [Mucilaginibacter sp. MD40]|uniref:DNA adenine methylase n=1 Tax=Mucilaginibacter sp. MD40 TaxID=2029590 RepID=UPI000BACCEE1|nr:Dam family site-specific DNA-(adenine-N6)-methyltransferase [Mucilaginibacter sp. MD40]PAW92483.1 DNA adenine methylase [Mucilaginibacter sp. MD40]